MTVTVPARTSLRISLAAAFTAAGYLHVTHPAPFVRIVPFWVPVPHATVVATGWCELAGAAGLLLPRMRRLAGSMLALYSVCVFPANIKHALDYAHGGGTVGWLYHGPRLLFQPAIVWWCLYSSGVIGWPFRSPDRAAPAPARLRPSARTG